MMPQEPLMGYTRRCSPSQDNRGNQRRHVSLRDSSPSGDEEGEEDGMNVRGQILDAVKGSWEFMLDGDLSIMNRRGV